MYYSTVLYLVALEKPSETSGRLLRVPVFIRNSNSQVWSKNCQPLHYNVWNMQIMFVLYVLNLKLPGGKESSVFMPGCKAGTIVMTLQLHHSTLWHYSWQISKTDAFKILGWDNRYPCCNTFHLCHEKNKIKKTMHYKKIK